MAHLGTDVKGLTQSVTSAGGEGHSLFEGLEGGECVGFDLEFSHSGRFLNREREDGVTSEGLPDVKGFSDRPAVGGPTCEGGFFVVNHSGFLIHTSSMTQNRPEVKRACATSLTGTLSPLRWVVGAGHIGKCRLQRHEASTQITLVVLEIFAHSTDCHPLFSSFNGSF